MGADPDKEQGLRFKLDGTHQIGVCWEVLVRLTSTWVQGRLKKGKALHLVWDLMFKRVNWEVYSCKVALMTWDFVWALRSRRFLTWDFILALRKSGEG